MKKKIALICCLVLVAISMLTVFAACNGNGALSDNELKILRSNLFNQYREDAAEKAESYKVLGEITGINADKEPIKCAIKWTIEGTDKVTVSADKDSNGNYTVNVPDPATLTDSISYTLKGTLVDDKGEAYKGYNGDENATYTVSFNRTVTRLGGDNELLQHYLPATIASPAMGTEYNLSVYFGDVNYVYYFTGKMSGNYFGLNKERSASVKVKLEAAEGGFYISFMDGATKKYLTFTGRAGTSSTGKATPYGDCSITEEPTTVFSVDTSMNNSLKATIVCGDLGENDFYLGSRPGYTTISATSSYYLTGSNSANIDSTQFVARLVGDEDFNQYGGIVVDSDELAKIRGQFEANPVEGTAYKLAVYKGSETLYFNGATQSQDYYLNTVKVKDNGVDCFIEKSGDGFYIYFMNSSGTKTYVTIILSGTYVNAKLTTDTPANGVFKMDTTLRIPYMEINENKYYLNSQGTYTSIGGATWSKMNQDNLDVSGEWAMRLMPSAD